MLKINEYLLVKQAAEFLGVDRQKLVRMDRDGILVAYKMPGSKYRYYTKPQLEKFLKSVQDANEFMGIK